MARNPRIVDLYAAPDPRDVVHQIVQTLAEGELVGLPTESGYVAAAHALQASGGERLAQMRQRLGSPRSVLALKSPLEPLDYNPRRAALSSKPIQRIVSWSVTHL